MKLSRTDIKWVHAALRNEMERRARYDIRGVPESLRSVALRFLVELRDPSDSEQHPDPYAVVDVAEAARRLGWNPRTVRRRARDLDGERVGRQWLFTRRAISEFIEATNAVSAGGQDTEGCARTLNTPPETRKGTP